MPLPHLPRELEPPALAPLDGEALARFADFARRCAPDAADAACERVARSRPVLVGFSGWPGAGKDTVPEVLFAGLGLQAEHVYFAVPLKDEVDRVISLCRDAPGGTEAADAVARDLDVPAEQARWAVSIIGDAVHADPSLHARTRTPEVRELLQVWGTDVRRSVDADYWVHKALGPAVEAIAQGRCAYLSDVRFPNEVDGARRLGFHVTRLVVSRDTVVGRLARRDGLAYEPEQLDAMLAHPAESSLDGYEGFDLVLDNEGTVDEAVSAVRRELGV